MKAKRIHKIVQKSMISCPCVNSMILLQQTWAKLNNSMH